jgi:hypothetical protein
MQFEARMAYQPALDSWMFMGGVIVQNDVVVLALSPKAKGKELFVLKWRKEVPGPAGKGSKAQSPSKSTLQIGASQTHIRAVPASENCEVATLPSKARYPFSEKL